MNGKSNLVGQWYLRREVDEILQVIGYDERSGTIEIQTFDGDLDEIATGEPVERVFHIINEHTRQTVETPSARSCRPDGSSVSRITQP